MARILVVDDDRSTALMLVEFLTISGHQATMEPDGLRAIQHVDLRLPDIILLDLMLPVVTGVEVARRLRLDPQSSHIPIVAITGVENPGDLADVLMVDSVLTKPLDLDELGYMIQALLAGQIDPPPDGPDEADRLSV